VHRECGGRLVVSPARLRKLIELAWRGINIFYITRNPPSPRTLAHAIAPRGPATRSAGAEGEAWSE